MGGDIDGQSTGTGGGLERVDEGVSYIGGYVSYYAVRCLRHRVCTCLAVHIAASLVSSADVAGWSNTSPLLSFPAAATGDPFSCCSELHLSQLHVHEESTISNV